jgi:hypothetical protein
MWDDLDETKAFRIGLDALGPTFAELVLHLGQPVDVQRKLEIRADVEWTIQCFLDLEAERPDHHDDTAAGIVDYKVKTTDHQAKADQRLGPDEPWGFADPHWPRYMVCGAAPGSERWFQRACI